MSESEAVSDRDELDALAPPPAGITLSGGLEVLFEELRARQFFKLLRIITHGAAPMLGSPGMFNLDGDAAQLAIRLTALVVMAVPDAEDETVDFVLSMVRPKDLKTGRFLDKATKARNEELQEQLAAELENPELEDLIDIIEGVVKRESEDLAALGKRLGSLLKLAKKTGQLPDGTTLPNSDQSPESNFSEGSPEPSTSSPVSTDGQTTNSETSRSLESVSVSQL